MKTICRPRLPLLLLVMLALTGCATAMPSLPPAGTIQQQKLAGLPYHPLVYHLDLSILAYQLYTQTLAWPFDPYYEELNDQSGSRAKFINKVRDWSKSKGAEQVKTRPGLGGFRGPGVLGGFEDNVHHDPIVYRYDRLHPWSQSIMHAEGAWTKNQTPNEIVGRIREVHMCYRDTARPKGEVAIGKVVSGSIDPAPGARDVLLAFEGGTGGKGEAGQPVSQSLMGFVLLRYWAGHDDYDVHIAFRGSQSGSVKRAVAQSFSDSEARGNPDWITDLGYNVIRPGNGGSSITTKGAVFRGFAQSMKSILPQLIHCLSKAARLTSRGRPNRIYVTGHSLGGALAQHFVSAMLLGERYGPDGTGKAMPAVLRDWPWQQIKMITFSSPRAGDSKWAETLTTRSLASDFLSTAIDPIDRAALTVNDPSIIPRLTDQGRPVGYRVVISTDPVTTQKVNNGKHVGKTIYVNEPGLLATFAAPDINAHLPRNVRKLMSAKLSDPRIPQTASRYRKAKDNVPRRDASRRGSIDAFLNLKDTVDMYYRGNEVWFDHAAFASDFEQFETLLRAN